MTDKMKAVVKTKPEMGATEIMMVDIPKPGPQEVLIKIDVVSICGTDVHIYNWDKWAAGRIKPPLIYGHEFAGEVVEIGANVDDVKVGDYVSGECHITCGHCYQCLNDLKHVCESVKIFGVDVPGIFAEYACIPASNVWHNDEAIPPELCSIQDPMGNAVHSVFATDVRGKDVVILGVGPIGTMCAPICKHLGAKNVFAIDKGNEYRLNLAKEVGADYVFDADDNYFQDIKDITKGKGVDVVLEMSGSVRAIDTALNLLRPGGDLILLGVYPEKVSIDLSEQVVFKNITIKGITGRRMFYDWRKVKELLNNDFIREQMQKIITHRLKFDEFLKGMEIMRSGKSGKVVLKL